MLLPLGGARVYCIHGNELDPWNWVRYQELARAARRLNAGQPHDIDNWRPNAGTKMVKEVMNSVKRRYASIDIIKPETSAAVGTLLVLDRSQISKLGELAGIVGVKVQGKFNEDARLSADTGFVEVGTPAAPARPHGTMDQR